MAFRDTILSGYYVCTNGGVYAQPGKQRIVFSNDFLLHCRPLSFIKRAVFSSGAHCGLCRSDYGIIPIRYHANEFE